MCNFVDQFGNIVSNVIKYNVDGTKVDPDQPTPLDPPRKCRPYDKIALLHAGEEQHVLEDGNWGMHVPNYRGITTNARDDRLEESSLWSKMWGVAGKHVVIPVSHGYERTTRTGEPIWSCIQAPGGEEPWFIAGLGQVMDGKYRTEWHVSMVTTDAGPVFTPIHDTPREVVCLHDWNAVETWLEADKEACLELIQPATPDVLETHRVHDDVLRAKFPVGKWPEPYNPPRQEALF